MRCEQENCHATIEEGEERVFHGRLLCEDCYMDALSPPRTCDPWAVRSASLAKEQGEQSEAGGLQSNILQMLSECGGLSREELAEKLQVTPRDLERELATLRHLEKIRAAMQGEKKVIVLW